MVLGFDSHVISFCSSGGIASGRIDVGISPLHLVWISFILSLLVGMVMHGDQIHHHSAYSRDARASLGRVGLIFSKEAISDGPEEERGEEQSSYHACAHQELGIVSYIFYTEYNQRLDCVPERWMTVKLAPDESNIFIQR